MAVKQKNIIGLSLKISIKSESSAKIYAFALLIVALYFGVAF